MRRPLLTRLASISVLLLFCMPGPLSATEAEPHVVILNGVDPYLPVNLAIDDAMRARLASDSGPPVILFSEACGCPSHGRMAPPCWRYRTVAAGSRLNTSKSCSSRSSAPRYAAWGSGCRSHVPSSRPTGVASGRKALQASQRCSARPCHWTRQEAPRHHDPREPAPVPLIHIVDDDDSLRTALVATQAHG